MVICRNKAAHPNISELSTAQECQVFLRKNLNLFLQAIKDNEPKI